LLVVFCWQPVTWLIAVKQQCTLTCILWLVVYVCFCCTQICKNIRRIIEQCAYRIVTTPGWAIAFSPAFLQPIKCTSGTFFSVIPDVGGGWIDPALDQMSLQQYKQFIWLGSNNVGLDLCMSFCFQKFKYWKK
jgi:hypothetical protein